MENVGPALAQGEASLAREIIKDTTASSLITKTLDHLNAGPAAAGGTMNADHQFQKEILNAAGIGNKLDVNA